MLSFNLGVLRNFYRMPEIFVFKQLSAVVFVWKINRGIFVLKQRVQESAKVTDKDATMRAFSSAITDTGGLAVHCTAQTHTHWYCAYGLCTAQPPRTPR